MKRNAPLLDQRSQKVVQTFPVFGYTFFTHPVEKYCAKELKKVAIMKPIPLDIETYYPNKDVKLLQDGSANFSCPTGP